LSDPSPELLQALAVTHLAGAGLCPRCYTRSPHRITVRAGNLAASLNASPAWLPGFAGYLETRHHWPFQFIEAGIFVAITAAALPFMPSPSTQSPMWPVACSTELMPMLHPCGGPQFPWAVSGVMKWGRNTNSITSRMAATG
jgi:hypothetical protein